MEETLYKELYDDFLPVFRKLCGTEVYSITLGGSHGKGIADGNSDFDFGIFYEKPAEREVRRLATYPEARRGLRKESWIYYIQRGRMMYMNYNIKR